ncbi:hypothetical protein VE04_00543 [Pseudogymnoascus sp. 24MN13]|nr:hypothetical protein VE04_00543 [Pseudogymnoascus sp. 24MN13]
MAELIGFGLSASDKLIDKHFDKLPDKLISPMGKDIPYITEKLHTQTGTNTEHNPHRRFRSPDSDSDSPYHSADARARRSRRDDRRSKHEDTRGRDNHAERSRRQRDADMREDSSPKPRHGQERKPEQEQLVEAALERFMDDPVARGAMGVAVGGVLAKQAVKAGDKWKDRGKGKGQHKGKGHTDDEILVTLAGMALGGVGLLFAGDKYKEKKEREKREERHSREKARRERVEVRKEENERERNTRNWVEISRDGEVERYMREEKIAEEGRGGGFYDRRDTYDDVWRRPGYDDRRRER